MIRKKADALLEPWLERAQVSPVSAFARGVRMDLAAVRAAIVSPWSNGQTEGHPSGAFIPNDGVDVI